jgi:glycosyltransferase involved in cell wall biosynthesis
MRSVDVCVPSYNYGRFLTQCVGSVLAQTGVDVRVLVIDDTSTDDTPAIGAGIAASDSRVEFRRHRANAGHLATYNEGIAWASAEYFVLLSADDMLTPGALERAVSVMGAHPEVGMVHGRQISFWSDEPPEAEAQDAGAATIVDGAAFVAGCCAGGVNTVSMPTVVLRTAAQKRVGGYRQGLPHTGDLEMWMRVAATGSGIACLSSAQAFRRRHDAAMHVAYTDTGLRDLEQHVAAFDSFFADPQCTSPAHERLKVVVRKTLGEQAFWRATQAFERSDAVTCDRFLDLATTLAPAIRRTRSWSRLRWKRRLGPRIWRRVQPLVTSV